jgi:NitT/TauT family transport system substrate-binding protein
MSLRLTPPSVWMAGCAALLLALAGCLRPPEQPLRIGTHVWIGSEPLYLARELGQLDPKTVQLVEYPSASEVLRAFRNQAIDGMVVSLDELFGLAIDGLEPRIVLVTDISHGAAAVVGRQGMASMHDLKGNRIAVESGALGAYVLSRALALSGMQAADVEIVYLESNEQPNAFKRGRIDGAVTFDPYRAQLINAGATTLFDSTRMPDEIIDLVAVRADVLKEQRKAVRTLLTGWFSALEYLKRDPEDAARRMGVRQQTSGGQFLHSLRGVKIPSREENLQLLAGDTPELVMSGSRLMDQMLDARLLRASVSIRELLAPELLQQLRP